MGVGRVVGKGGWGEALIEVLNQNRYRYIQFGYRKTYYEEKSAEIMIFGGFPQFLAGNPRVITSHSRKNVTFSLRKREGGRFHLITYARRSSHLGKLKKMPHFEISNSNIKAIRQPIGPKLEI